MSDIALKIGILIKIGLHIVRYHAFIHPPLFLQGY